MDNGAKRSDFGAEKECLPQACGATESFLRKMLADSMRLRGFSNAESGRKQEENQVVSCKQWKIEGSAMNVLAQDHSPPGL